MSDNSFFAELQGEFLTESAFLLESYEESMLGLENGENPGEYLTQIFRVAHSVKGGAAAVGLSDLSKFAHVVEDLLDLLRTNPELVNANVITLLLKSGDELKKRISNLQAGKDLPWDTTELVQQLVAVTEKLSGKPSKKHNSPPPESDQKEAAPDDFFTSASQPTDDDNTNHELLAELLSQLSPEEQAEFHAREQASKPAVNTDLKLVDPHADLVTAPQVVTEKSSSVSPEVKTEAPKVSASGGGGSSSSSSGSGGKSPTTGKPATSSIKVDTARVDSVLDAVGELVVLKNQLVHDETVRNSGNLRLEAIVDQLDKSVRELYEKTLSIRMTPLKSLFIKIQRIVRDVSLNLDKPVNLVLQGEETEVERTVFELLNDPLVHLVRNAMDHGVENKETRKQRGKPEVARVVVSAKQSGGNVVIDIVDDGGGINREKVLAKAIERGLVPAGVDPQTLSDEQVFQFIFKAGFSTAEKISDLSGRGVGLDVVKSNLDKINGKMNIFSKLGAGTTFRMTIPLSTAITDGIVVAMEGSRYILPIHSIREIVRVMPKDYTEISDSGKVVNIRGVLMPVIEVDRVLGDIKWNLSDDSEYRNRAKSLDEKRSEETMLVVLESMTGQMAMPVDDVLGQAQVVVKPIGGTHIPEVAGAAILGDGKTVLILEPGAIVATFSSGVAA